MSNNIQVNFKVAGGELANYLSEIKKKSDSLTTSAIAGALEQNKYGKEQIVLINDQIKAMERKARMEGQAYRSIVLDRQSTGLQAVRDRYEGAKNNVFSDTNLSDKAKKEKIIALEGSQKEAELNVKNQYRENLNYVRENERQAKLQTQLAKEQIDTLKETAAKNVKAITSGDLKLADVINNSQTADEKLVAQLTEEGVRDRKKDKSQNGIGVGGVMSGILAADNINKLLSTASQFASTQNGFDLIQPASNTLGRVIGGLLGGAVGALAGGVGAVGGAALGSQIGGEFGSGIGALAQRSAIMKQDFQKAKNRFQSITGKTAMDMPLMENVGIDATQFITMQSDAARRRGYSNGSGNTSRDAIYAERAYGVEQSTSGSLIEMQRSSREGNRDLANLIAAVIEKGQGNIFKDGDNTFLNEFLGKFASLQKELLKSQSVVPTGTTMDILGRFNKLGGEFDLRDPRSMGNINAIQNGLANPGSDNIKAVAYRVLSRKNPNMGMFDLDEEMSKGLGSDGYLKEMLGFIDQVGGGDQMKMKNLQGLFKGLSPSAIRRVYNNKEGLMNGNLSVDELKANFPNDFQDRAEANTAPIEKTQASINNGILLGEAIEKMSDAFETAIREALSGAVIEMKDGNTIKILPVMKANVTKKPAFSSDPNSIMKNFDGSGTIYPSSYK